MQHCTISEKITYFWNNFKGKQILGPLNRISLHTSYLLRNQHTGLILSWVCMLPWHGHWAPGLKLGWIILVIRVMFWPGQAVLTDFIKYPGVTWILHWHVLIMVCGADQSDRINYAWWWQSLGLTVQLEYFDHICLQTTLTHLKSIQNC